jgi:group I intron endonuclease
MKKFAQDGSRLFEVYMHTSKASGKSYIGITCTGIRSRLYSHESETRQGSMKPFHRALRRYGIEGFTTTVLAVCFGLEAANAFEIELIETYQTFGKGGYNATKGGEGTSGVAVTAARRKAISKQFKELVRTPEHKARISKALKGLKKPYMAALNAKKLGVPQDLVRKVASLDALDKARASWSGEKHKPESRRAMRDAKSYPIRITRPSGEIEIVRTTLGALAEQYGISTAALSQSIIVGRAIAKAGGLKGCRLERIPNI